MAIGGTKQGIKFAQGSTKILGRKRVVVSPTSDGISNLGSPVSTRQKRRSTRRHMEKSSLLESLPQDVLVKVLCKVNHSDLKHLLLVSKSISEATSVARKLHFAYATPSSKRAYRGDRPGEDDEEAPNAPKQQRVARSRIEGKNVASIAVNLFASSNDLFVEV